MPAARPRARRATIREVLDIAIELEKKTMALYVTFVKAFPRPEEVRNFWFGMARHEAAHCGALSLVESILESDPRAAAKTHVWFDPTTVTRLRALLAAYQRETRSGVGLERAFEMAIDIEASELEDVVVDMLSLVRTRERLHEVHVEPHRLLLELDRDVEDFADRGAPGTRAACRHRDLP